MKIKLFCDCGNIIEEFECNGCRTKKISLMLAGLGTNVNTASHIIRDIKKVTQDDVSREILCPGCNENLISICQQCYIEKVKDVIFYYFPQDVFDSFVRLSKKL